MHFSACAESVLGIVSVCASHAVALLLCLCLICLNDKRKGVLREISYYYYYYYYYYTALVSRLWTVYVYKPCELAVFLVFYFVSHRPTRQFLGVSLVTYISAADSMALSL